LEGALCHCIEQNAQSFFCGDFIVGTLVAFAKAVLAMLTFVPLLTGNDTVFDQIDSPTPFAR
jgi:hypothetical protein